MIYVDSDLCAGCGICVNVCKDGAMSMEGDLAVIDQALCTACGRCIEVCPADAILEVEVEAERPAEATLASPTGVQAAWPTVPEPGQTGIESPTRAGSGGTKTLGTLGKVVSGILGIADYAIEHDLLTLRPRSGSGRAARRTPRGAGAPGAGRACRRDGSGRGRGRRRAGGGAGSGRPGGGRRAHRQKRTW